MSYEEFVCAMEVCTKNNLPDTMKVEVQQVLKNNGVTQVGLVIRDPEQNIAPLIYLEGFYEKYLQGQCLEELCELLISYGMMQEQLPEWDFEEITDFEKIRDKIVYKLVNAEMNAEFLKEVPHLPLFDLAVVFYLAVSVEPADCGSILIRNSHMNLWKQPISVIYEMAKRNTSRIFPPVLKPLCEYLEEMTGEPMEESKILLLTNHVGVNGAAVMLYPEILKKIYEILENTYYLLPASVHELLIIPETGEEDAWGLKEMVRDVNDTQLEQDELLSYNIYHFDGESITEM